ncbi:MAG TPA: PKD domain-containing protein [Vicinamibacterales bacterium]
MKAWCFRSVVAAVCVTAGVGAAEAQQQLPRFVPDVVAQFDALTERPDAMGFELRGPDPSQCRHMQAIVRVDAPDGTPYLLVSRSGKDTGVVCYTGSERANVYIVKMGSRDTNGERLRSNRMRRDMETTNTPPDPADGVVDVLLFDGTEEWPHYEHPGGMQQVGNIVALALEEGKSGQPSTKILFIDVTNPEEPVMLENSFVPPTSKAGVVGITACGTGRANMPCATGHYLMLVTGGDNDQLLFFESNGSDLTREDLDWTLLYTWDKSELIGGEWPKGHQTLHFIREGSLAGNLFLAGARPAGFTIEGNYADDYIDLYQVGFDAGKIELTRKSTKHQVSHPTGEGILVGDEVLWGARLASFAAASGFHVTPTGELLFYATEHDNDGPEGSNGRSSVKMGEWRHIDMFRPGSPAYAPTIVAPLSVTVNEGSSVGVAASAGPPVARPWMQFFEATESRGRFVVADHADLGMDNFDDFKKLDKGYSSDVQRFTDRATSWRWFAPSTCSIRANEHHIGDDNFPGARTFTLFGTGQPEKNGNLHDVKVSNGDDMWQVVSSVQFSSACSSYYSASIGVQWDLDFNGTVDTAGDNVTLSAAAIDGPADRVLTVQAQHPTDGRIASRTIAVRVNNVNPVVTGWTLVDRLGNEIGVDVPFLLRGRPVRGLGTFKDAGALDTQTGSVAWGDSIISNTFTTFTDAFGGGEGHAEATHTYTAPGPYTVALRVRDDDGGVGVGYADVTVVTPADAVQAVVNLLDALIATAGEPARSYLLSARKALDGPNAAGQPSGALSKIKENQKAAALSQLANALSDLAKASGVDTAASVAILDEVVASLQP